jgi:type VII secretion protein EccB
VPLVEPGSDDAAERWAMGAVNDELRSRRYALGRVVTALASGVAAPAGPRHRAGLVPALLGALLVLAVLAAAHGYTALGGDRSAWRTGGAILVERETGARYVLLAGRLHPVANYVSARLLLGLADPPVLLVRRGDLAAADRGATLGIAGAPDSLPAPDAMSRDPWTICSTTGAHTATVLLVGGAAGGVALGPRALLVQAPGGPVTLLWEGRRRVVQDADVVLPALGWAARNPVPVATALLSAVPVAPALARLRVDGWGRPGAAGAPVGEVALLTTAGGSRQFLVSLLTGYAVISELEADLLLGDPRTVDVLGQRRPRVVSAAEYARAPHATRPAGWSAGPGAVPRLAESGGAVCARPGDGPALLWVAASPPEGVPVRHCRVDRVASKPGAAVLAGAGGGPLTVVSGAGVRYPLADAAARQALGLSDVPPVAVPAALLDLLPVGPTLDRAAAAREVPAAP